MGNNKAPHKTVIWVTAMTYEVLPTGECSGKPIKTVKKIYQVVGNNQDICIEKTNKKIEELDTCLK